MGGMGFSQVAKKIIADFYCQMMKRRSFWIYDVFGGAIFDCCECVEWFFVSLLNFEVSKKLQKNLQHNKQRSLLPTMEG
jgi:hypothetical protein